MPAPDFVWTPPLVFKVVRGKLRQVTPGLVPAQAPPKSKPKPKPKRKPMPTRRASGHLRADKRKTSKPRLPSKKG